MNDTASNSSVLDLAALTRVHFDAVNKHNVDMLMSTLTDNVSTESSRPVRNWKARLLAQAYPE
jgi:hypothetical protein